MGADSLTQNTPNHLKFICPSPNVWDFNEKRLHWASVVGDCKCGIIPEENGLYPGSNRGGDLFLIFFKKLNLGPFMLSGVL